MIFFTNNVVKYVEFYPQFSHKRTQYIIILIYFTSVWCRMQTVRLKKKKTTKQTKNRQNLKSDV